ncbi:MAG TPA: amino-acid N-acetyltransferase [Actinomycetaceae bacterium]|nr:amino-acid N-acetyltransferase [Actinomycetaceae bacterium]
MIVRPALPRDVIAIRDIVEPWAHHEKHVLLPRDLVGYYEAIQEFAVVEIPGGGGAAEIIGCGALHVMWEDLAEVRTLAVSREHLGRGAGHALLVNLLERAQDLGLKRVFCLTFEVEFFMRHGFEVVEGPVVEPEVFAEMLRSHDVGVAEFLDLAWVKPNTLGNSRMLLTF